MTQPIDRVALNSQTVRLMYIRTQHVQMNGEIIIEDHSTNAFNKAFPAC